MLSPHTPPPVPTFSSFSSPLYEDLLVGDINLTPSLTHLLRGNTCVCSVSGFHPLFASERHPATDQTSVKVRTFLLLYIDVKTNFEHPPFAAWYLAFQPSPVLQLLQTPKCRSAEKELMTGSQTWCMADRCLHQTLVYCIISAIRTHSHSREHITFPRVMMEGDGRTWKTGKVAFT